MSHPAENFTSSYIKEGLVKWRSTQRKHNGAAVVQSGAESLALQAGKLRVWC